MDEQITDNSDNDSIESWTLINQKLKTDASSASNEQLDTVEMRSPNRKMREDDTDTDGISVISDEELDMQENVADDVNVQEKNVSSTVECPVFNIQIPDVNKPLPNTKQESKDFDYNPTNLEELSDEYFTAGAKTRSYIHKRNNKLSTILNMILIGTIVTTACLAVGHIWGTTDDCSPEMYDSISELLYNMQELQHENFVLKSKIKLLENKKNRPTYVPIYDQSINIPNRAPKESGLNADGINDTDSDTFERDLMALASRPLIDDDIVSLRYEPMNESVSNDEEEKPKESTSEYTKREYKRSISGTHQNAYVGPKEYDEFIMKPATNGFKYKRDKHSYDLDGNGNVSKPDKKKYDEFKNVKWDEKKINKYYKQQKKDEEFRNNKLAEKKFKHKPKLYRRDKYVLDETDIKKPAYFENNDSKNGKNEKYKNYRKQYKKYNRDSADEGSYPKVDKKKMRLKSNF